MIDFKTPVDFDGKKALVTHKTIPLVELEMKAFGDFILGKVNDENDVDPDLKLGIMAAIMLTQPFHLTTVSLAGMSSLFNRTGTTSITAPQSLKFALIDAFADILERKIQKLPSVIHAVQAKFRPETSEMQMAIYFDKEYLVFYFKVTQPFIVTIVNLLHDVFQREPTKDSSTRTLEFYQRSTVMLFLSDMAYERAGVLLTHVPDVQVTDFYPV